MGRSGGPGWRRGRASRGVQSSSGEHQSDGRGGVVYVDRASGGDQLCEAGRVLVGVAHVERNGQAAGAGLGADDREAKHPDQVPKPAGFVLAGDTGRDGNALLIDSASDENREADARFLGRFRDFDLKAVRNRLRAGVLVDDIPLGAVGVCCLLFCCS